MSLFTISGGFTGLVASSRVRLARNLTGYPFALTADQQTEIARKVFAALQSVPAIAPAFSLSQVLPDSAEAAVLVQQHRISPAFAHFGGWLIASHDGGVAIMIGEEDHLRLQVIGSGLCPKECLEAAERISSLIENEHPFAYDERLGYLTACPTNVGTGLRTSVMLHLPVLIKTGGGEALMGYAGSCGCAVRGAYGEGSKATGGFYQLSNQVTLGASSAELTDVLIKAATTVIEAEKKARESVRAESEPVLRDNISRAVAIMRFAHLIETGEALECISQVLVGLQMGLLSGADPAALYQLQQRIHPALLGGTPLERDQNRATLLREASKSIEIL